MGHLKSGGIRVMVCELPENSVPEGQGVNSAWGHPDARHASNRLKAGHVQRL